MLSRNSGPGALIAVLATSFFLVVVLIVVVTQWPSAPSEVDSRPTGVSTPAATDLPLEPTQATWDVLATPSETPVAEPSFTYTPPAVVSPSTVDTVPPAIVASTPVTPGAARTPGAMVYVAVAGNGCASSATTGAAAGFTAGRPVTSVAGGWVGTGCTGGRFWSVPMSGAAGQDDAAHVLWWFGTQLLRSGRCQVWVYVPKGEHDTDAAGEPTYYQVLRGRDDQAVIGQFTVDQTATRGTWVLGGDFLMTGGTLAVRLVSRGTGAGGARHGASAIEVGCAAA